MMADAIGLTVLAVLVACVSLFVPAADITPALWIFIYLGWAVCSLFVWHLDKAPKRASQWLRGVIWSVLCAVLWYALARLISRLAFEGNEAPLSRAIDVGVALMLTPGLAFIAFSGWIRALFLTRGAPQTADESAER